MSRGRPVVFSLVLGCVLLATLPALAVARSAYVTGATEESTVPYAVPVDLAAQAPGTEVPLPGGGEGAPNDVAITPDGATAYVPNFPMNEVVPIDVASNAAGTPIEVPEPNGVAISPDGSRVYVSNRGGAVYAIDTATNVVVAGPIAVGNGPAGLAVTPDGARVYVVDSGVSDDVRALDTATNAVVATIAGAGGNAISIAPDGTRAFVVDGLGNTVPIDLASDVAGAPIVGGDFLSDVAILPDGSMAFAVSNGNLAHGLLPVDLTTSEAGSVFPVGDDPEAIAIVPNQPPRASFTHSPEPASPGSAVSFDASASSDADGAVTRYDWDFGDGGSTTDAGANPQHTYAEAGSYQVTVTETDDEGCSTSLVFTGQTAYCNGSSVARATRTVVVESQATPVSVCPTVKPRATSFKPKIRPGNIVPGVRVRLATGGPALFTVHAKLLWTRGGTARRTRLRTLSVAVNRWRRVRFPIPSRLRNVLPLGSRVRLRLRIQATPRRASGCATTTIDKVLRVRVVKVFPHAVQAKRPR